MVALDNTTLLSYLVHFSAPGNRAMAYTRHEIVTKWVHNSKDKMRCKPLIPHVPTFYHHTIGDLCSTRTLSWLDCDLRPPQPNP